MMNILDDDYIIYGDDEKKIPRNLNFLIVDDEQDICGFLEDCIESMGFKGHHKNCHSVESALQLCQDKDKAQIDFILCDWNLENLSGLDFLKEVRNIENLKNTPFIMVTANDNVSGMLVANKKGCSDYLVKPFTIEELEEKILASWEKHS